MFPWNLRIWAAALFAVLPFARAQDSISFNLDTYSQDDPTGTPFQSYMSNTEVKPPQLQINKNSSGLAPGLVFVGVDGKPTSGQNWPAIFGECFHIEELLNSDVLIAEPKTD
jgi:hypothetical protein